MGNLVATYIVFKNPTDAPFDLEHRHVVVRDDDVSIPVVFYPCPESSKFVLYCHGIGENITHINVKAMSEILNANIVSFDFAGYGLHTLKKPSEQEAYKDTFAVYSKFILPRVKNDASQVSIVGFSLGASLAMKLVCDIQLKNMQPPKSLHLLASMYSALSIVTFFECDSLDCFQNYKLAPQINSCKVTMYHAQNDKTVPVACAEKLQLLFDPTPVLHIYEDRTHGNIVQLKHVWACIKMDL
jgi:esterase/lipase